VSRRVLLTGAAGRVASAFREYAGERYWLRLADRVTERLADARSQGQEIFELDIADLEACQRACQDMDTVIHLAADPSEKATFYGSLLDNNVKGAYNIFRAAKDQGCRRVIFASSIHAVEAYPLDTQIHPSMPVRPADMYGVCKCFGEAMASYFAYTEGLSSIAIRIGAFDNNLLTRERLNIYISRRDLCHLLVQCIETPNIQFALVHGVSNNRFKRLDLMETRALLNYEPQDDAFEIFNIE
jgi:NAD+ dependent glucose-6-phosphate dehydrogenase